MTTTPPARGTKIKRDKAHTAGEKEEKSIVWGGCYATRSWVSLYLALKTFNKTFGLLFDVVSGVTAFGPEHARVPTKKLLHDAVSGVTDIKT